MWKINRMQVFQMSTEEKQMMAYFPDAEWSFGLK